MKKIILGSVTAGMILVGCGGENYPKEITDNKYFQICKDEHIKEYGDGFKEANIDERSLILRQCFEQKENEEKRKNK